VDDAASVKMDSHRKFAALSPNVCCGIAMCGRFLFSKVFFDVVIIAGCGHVSGLYAQHRWPLALMKSACQVPIKLLDYVCPGNATGCSVCGLL